MSMGRFSDCSTRTTPKIYPPNIWKSDMYIPTSISDDCSRNYRALDLQECSGEYYKKYEHDELPEKDSADSGITNALKESGDNEIIPLTNSRLDRLETKIMNIVSQELQTDAPSVCSLDSNIKFFKTTVEQIFETFYATMNDFEVYKKRFHDILEKNKTQSIAEMEEFIKEMIQHIASSESVVGESHKSSKTFEAKEKETTGNVTKDCLSVRSIEFLENIHSVVEAYKNESYSTDSTNNEKNATKKHVQKVAGEIFNIYLLSNSPYVKIKMNDRNMCSEINFKDSNIKIEPKVASAGNLKVLAAKKKKLDIHPEIKPEVNTGDIEIPIRVSSAKKNIHLDEDFTSEHEKNEKSIMSRICNFLCRRFRKTL